MKCPHCDAVGGTEVRDSRPTEGDVGIRRRRLCMGCGERFTTYEVPRRFVVGMGLSADGRSKGARAVRKLLALVEHLSEADAILLTSLAGRLVPEDEVRPEDVAAYENFAIRGAA